MRRCIALLLSVLLLMTAAPWVSADSYNDDQFDWGELACPHTYTEEVEEIPSTCIEQGRSGYTRCADCKLLLSGSKESLPLADHTYDNACDADCNVCGQKREVGAHDYHTVTVVPDCENSGYTVHTCTVCGHSYADGRVEALGHTYRVTEDVAPTCVADGRKVYGCAACGDSYTETVPATGRHVYDFACDEICNVCGYVRSDAHFYTFMGRVEPTCGEDGSDGYKCWECGAVRYDVIPATGKHIFSGVCDADCNVCGYDRGPVASHSYELTASVERTCVTDGTKTYTCQHCGDSYTEVIPAEGHKYRIVITAPDCENGGYTTHTCTVCGDVCVDNRVDALGHVYDDAFDADCNVCGDLRQPLLRGDVDGNGKCNNRDLGLLLRHLNGWTVTVTEAADLNGDGKINNQDLGLLQRLLNA
ncbi:MAG: dockerin type I repeat-containing protein [Clostridia bacterium]|nr:dockerin type I repeat-containing protein [Clostridia bacterium]